LLLSAINAATATKTVGAVRTVPTAALSMMPRAGR
jgi:hypothetical protein